MATTVEQLQLLLTLDDQLSGRLNQAIEGLRNLATQASATGSSLDGIKIRVTTVGESASKAATGIREVATASADVAAAVSKSAVYVGTAASSYGAMSAAVAQAAQEWTVASVAAKVANGSVVSLSATMGEAASVVAGFQVVAAGTIGVMSGMSAAVVQSAEAWAAALVAAAQASGVMLSMATAMAAAEAAALGFGGVAQWTATNTQQLALGAAMGGQAMLMLGSAAQVAEMKLLAAGSAMRAALPPIGGGTWAWGDGSAGSSALAVQSRFAGAAGGYGGNRGGVGGGPFSPLGANQTPLMLPGAFEPTSGSGSFGFGGKTREIDEADKAARGFVSTMTRLLEIVAIFTLARGIGEMVSFAATIETTKIGLAGLVATYNDITTASGQTLQGTAKLNAAFLEADDIQKRLIATEIRTGVSLDTLTKGFLSIYGFGTAIGGTKSQLVDLSAELANLAVSENIPFETLARQMGLAEGGFMRMNSRLGALLKSLNIDQSVLATWRDQGVLVENLVEKLKFFELMGDRIAGTWTGAMTTLKTTLGLVLSTGFEPLFEAVKKGIIDTRRSMMTVQPGATAESAPTLVFDPVMMSKAREVAGSLADAFRALMPLLPPLVNLLGSMVEAFARFVTVLSESGGLWVIRQFITLTSAVVDAVGPEVIAIYSLSKAYLALAAAKMAGSKMFGTVIGAGGTGAAEAGATGGAGAVASGVQTTLIIGSIVGTVAALNAALTGARDLMADLFVNSMKWDAAQFFPNMERAIANSLPGFQTLERVVNKAAGLVGLNVSGPKADAQADTRKAESLENANRAIYAAIRAGGDLMSSDLKTIQVTNELVETYVNLRQRLYDGTIGVDEFNAAMKKAHDTAQLTISAHKEINTKDQEKLGDRLSSLRAQSLQLESQIAGLGESMGSKLTAASLSAAASLVPLNHQMEMLKTHSGDPAEIAALQRVIDKTKELGGAQASKIREDQAQKDADKAKKDAEDAAKIAKEALDERRRIQQEGIQGEDQYQKAIAALAAVGVDTKERAIQRAYDRGMEQIREDVRRAEMGLEKEILALMDTGTQEQFDAMQRRADAIGALEKAAGERLLEVKRSADARLLAAQTGDWATYEIELKKHYATVDGLNEYAAGRRAAKQTAEDQMAAAQTGTEGAAAAWKYLTATVKSEADTQRDYVLDSYRSMRSGFDDILTTTLSGKWSEFGNVFKGINDGMLKNLTKTLGDMAERWVTAQVNMGKYKNDPDYVPSRDPANQGKGGVFGTGMSEGQALGTFYAAASAGAGMATGGAASFWGGMQGYLSIASAVAQIPAIGAYAAAAVALTGVVVNLMAARQENTEAFMLMGNKNQRIGNTPGEQELFSMKDWVSSSLAEIFNAGASTSDARALMGQLNTLIYDYVKDKWFTVTAGSDQDFAADIKKLISGVFPQQLLHVLFGNPGGDRGADIAGIGGARQYDATVFDPNAPIPKFLEGLGFTARKIKELSLTVDQISDPKVWMEKLKGMVEVAVRFGDAITNLGKNTSGVWGDVLSERGASPGASFAAQADKLTLLAQQLSLYAGDEQIAKAKELAGLVEQYLQAQKVAISQLLDLAAGFTKTVDTQLLKNQDAGKSPDNLRTDAWTRVQGIFMGRDFNAGTLAGARTADQVTAIAQQGLADLQLIWGQLTAMSTQAATLKTSFSDLAKQLSMSNAEIWDAAHKNPFRVISENIADMQDSLKYASTFEVGSQAWLDVMGKIKDQGVATFQAIADEIDKIHTAQVSMNADIEDQINSIRRSGLGNQAQLDKWNQEIDKLTTALAGTNLSAEERAWDTNRLSTLQGYTKGYDPKQQIDDLKNTIAENRAKLATAQTPEEIQRLQGLISRDTNTYLGLFNNDNQTPETQARAREWATEQLRATQREANAAFDAMNAVLTHARETLRDTITGIGPMMEEATKKLRDELWHVQMAFERLRNEVNAAYVAMAGSITDPNSGLQAALSDARLLITDAVNPALVGFTGAVNDAKTALGKFTSGLSNPAPGSNPVTTGGSGAAGQNFATTPTQASMFGVARTIDWSRRQPNLLQPQQGVRV